MASVTRKMSAQIVSAYKRKTLKVVEHTGTFGSYTEIADGIGMIMATISPEGAERIINKALEPFGEKYAAK